LAVSAASSVAPVSTQAEPDVTKGTLSITSIPSRAKVHVEGVYFGLTPLRAEFAVGVYEVSINLEGYKTSAEKVSIRKGDSTEMEIKLLR
jgi:hypothetical protein